MTRTANNARPASAGALALRLARALASTAWAGAFIMAGALLLSWTGSGSLANPWLWLGACCLIAGNWLLVVFVINPLVPATDQRLADVVEIMMTVLLALAALTCAVLTLARGAW